ncbi:MAG: glycosyltransferase, partial [Opitutales bacterium]|nr:glycosyltransferase [Opitutales bacterium]
PSLFEGFGMPVAEAILAGTPVACSNIAPLREIGGDAIVTFDPRSTDAIVEALLKALGDSELRASLLEKGTERRKAFSPEAIARKICDLYRRVAGLDSIEYDSYVPKRDLRRGKAQHWGRVYDNQLLEGRRIGGAFAWLAAFWNSPSMAMRLRDRYSRRTHVSDPISTSSFKGRYGDGWIGPEFQDWLMIPSGAKRLELSFEAPPEPLGSVLIIQFSIDGNQVCTGRFEGNPELHLAATLSEPSSDLVEIRIECSGFFIPKEEGFSEDSRELSVKLVETSWS